MGRLPLRVKVGYTGYALVLVPVYWKKYGPANFLWISDTAFLGTGVALWAESPLIAGMMAGGSLVPELLWNLDFFFRLLTRRKPFNIAGYMFNPATPLYLRALSGFHLFLPPLEVWLVSRLGYPRQAWKYQALLSCIQIPASRLFSDEKRNVNWVYGPVTRQRTLPDPVYIAAVTAVVIAGFLLPGHLLLRRFFTGKE